jgi:hypothetical protein
MDAMMIFVMRKPMPKAMRMLRQVLSKLSFRMAGNMKIVAIHAITKAM